MSCKPVSILAMIVAIAIHTDVAQSQTPDKDTETKNNIKTGHVATVKAEVTKDPNLPVIKGDRDTLKQPVVKTAALKRTTSLTQATGPVIKVKINPNLEKVKIQQDPSLRDTGSNREPSDQPDRRGAIEPDGRPQDRRSDTSLEGSRHREGHSTSTIAGPTSGMDIMEPLEGDEIIMLEDFEGDWPSGCWTVFGDPTWDDDDYQQYTGTKAVWCANGGEHGLDPEDEREVIILEEGFEGMWPGEGWEVSGDPTWDDDDFRYHDPEGEEDEWAAWCANGGEEGRDPDGLIQHNNYFDDMDAWMEYGPFDLCDAERGGFEFWELVEVEDSDSCIFGLSTNGRDYIGYSRSDWDWNWGDRPWDWRSLEGDFGNFRDRRWLGELRVWLGFKFYSDRSGTADGWWVDDIIIRKWVRGLYYPNDMNAWMIYGPFDTKVEDGDGMFEFYVKYRTEEEYDFFFYGLSMDQVEYNGNSLSGDGWNWHIIEHYFSDFPGRYWLDLNTVWLGFHFESDVSNADYGCWVDNVGIALHRIPFPPSHLDNYNTGPGGSQHRLIWDDESDIENHYRIQVSVNGGEWADAALVPGNSTSYTTPRLPDGDRYYVYRIRAEFDDDEYSRWADFDWELGSGDYVDESLPQELALCENFPNPFNSSTTIPFSVPCRTYVSVSIFDINGQYVETIVQGQLNAGKYKAIWDAGDLNSGLYIVRLSTRDLTLSRKILFIK